MTSLDRQEMWVANNKQQMEITIQQLKNQNNGYGQLNSCWKGETTWIKSSKLLLFLMILQMLIHYSYSYEVQIMTNPNLSDIIYLYRMKSLYRYRQRRLKIKGHQYLCTTLINPHIPSHSIQHQKQQHELSTIPKNLTLDLEGFHKLNLLTDKIGVIYQTSQFYYLYRHKEMVRQFDDELIRVRYGKKNHQDILLGQYVKDKYEKYNQQKINPQRYYIINNVLSPINQRKAYESINTVYFDRQNMLIKMTNPLYITSKRWMLKYIIKLKCQIKSESISHDYILTVNGVSLSNFEILIFSPNLAHENCNKIQNIQRNRYGNVTELDVIIQGNMIKGNLQQSCVTANDGIYPGDYLFIKVFVGKQAMENRYAIGNDADREYRYLLVKIQEIVGENLYIWKNPLKGNLSMIACQKIQRQKLANIEYNGQIYSNRQKVFDIKSQAIKQVHIDYIGSRLMRIHEQQSSNTILDVGMNMFCSIFYKDENSKIKISHFSITVGKKFGDEFYEIYPWIKKDSFEKFQSIAQNLEVFACLANISSSGEEEDTSININNNIQAKQQQKIQQSNSHQLSNQQKISQFPHIRYQKYSKQKIIKLNSYRYPSIQQKQIGDSDNNIYMITLLVDSAIQITTCTTKQNITIIRKYIILQSKIYKIQAVYKNGKRVTISQKNQNTYYQNSTSTSMVIIHKSIWRGQDYIKYPRFLFQLQEKIIKMEMIHGIAYIRVFNLEVYEKESFAVSNMELDNRETYGPKSRPNISLRTEYKYKDGLFCNPPINKSREINVTLSCGQSWFKIQQILEIEPCRYQIHVITQYLCDGKRNINRETSIGKDIVKSLCVPSEKVY